MAQDYVGQYNIGKSSSTGNYLDTSGDGSEYGGEGSNDTLGNSLALGGAAIPTIYNFIQGFKKVKKTDPKQFYNPYEAQIKGMYGNATNEWGKVSDLYNTDPTATTNNIAANDLTNTGSNVSTTFDQSQNAARQFSNNAISTLKNRKYNIDPVIQQAELASRLGAEDARQYSTTGAEYMNRRNAVLSDRTRNVANAYNTKNNVEAQYLGDTANAMMGRANMEQGFGQERNQANLQLLAQRMQNYQMRNQSAMQQQAGKAAAYAGTADAYGREAAGYNDLGQQRTNANMYANQQDAAANAAKKAYLAKGFEGLGGIATTAAKFFL